MGLSHPDVGQFIAEGRHRPVAARVRTDRPGTVLVLELAPLVRAGAARMARTPNADGLGGLINEFQLAACITQLKRHVPTSATARTRVPRSAEHGTYGARARL